MNSTQKMKARNYNKFIENLEKNKYFLKKRNSPGKYKKNPKKA